MVKKDRNPLEALVLAKTIEGPLSQSDNNLGLDETKILACRDMRQALMIQELQNQELFPECELEIIEGSLDAVLAMIDGYGADDCGQEGENQYTGLICSYSELDFLGLAHRARAIFTVEELIPPLGQGSITALEGAAMQAFVYELELNPESITTVFAEGDEEGLELWGLYYDEETGQWWTDWIVGDPEQPELSGREFAKQLRDAGQWMDGGLEEDDWDEE